MKFEYMIHEMSFTYIFHNVLVINIIYISLFCTLYLHWSDYISGRGNFFNIVVLPCNVQRIGIAFQLD